MRWSRGYTIAAVALVSLLLAYGIKQPCNTHEWQDYYQYENFCYSDILPLYYHRGMETDQMPYVEAFNEYPVLTGLFSYGVAKATEGLRPYMEVTFAILLAAGALATWTLWKSGGFDVALLWGVVPAVPVHGLTNWDLLAVAATGMGWWLWRTNRAFGSALAFGLGGAAKLYPAFFLPMLFWYAVRKKNTKQMWWLLGGGTLGLGVPNAYVAMQSPHGWLDTWKFHSERYPDFETPWKSAVEPLGQPFFPNFDWADSFRSLVSNVSLTAMVIGLLWLAWRVWKKGDDPLVAGFALTAIFLLFNRVYSPQYTLWILPMLLLLGSPRLPLGLFIVADTMNFYVRYRFFTPPDGQAQGWDFAWEPWSRLSVNVRWVALAWASVVILRNYGLWPGMAPRQPGTPDTRHGIRGVPPAQGAAPAPREPESAS